MDSSINDQPVKSSIETSHLLKGVDICSIWDGMTDHAALARINILIESEPNIRLTLLELNDDHVNSAVVTDIQMLPTSSRSASIEQISSNCSDNPSIPLDAQSTFDKTKSLDSNKENCINIKDILPRRKRRLFPLYRSANSFSRNPRRSVAYLSSSFETPSEILSSDLDLSLTMSSGTVEVHPESKTPCPIKNYNQSSRQSQKYTSPTDIPISSSRRHCEACNRSGFTPYDRRSDGPQQGPELIRSHANNRKSNFPEEPYKTAKQVDFQPQKSFSRGPSQLSELDAFSNGFVELCSSELAAINPHNSTANQISFEGAQANENLQGNCETIYEDWSPFSKLTTRLSGTVSKLSDENKKSLCSMHEEPWFLSLIPSGCSRIPISNGSSLVRSYANASIQVPLWPDFSSQVWPCGSLKRGQSFLGLEIACIKRSSESLSKVVDNLELHFTDDVIAGIYRIEIEASIRIVKSDVNDWWNFTVPGLLRPQEAAMLGTMNFELSSLPPDVDENSLMMPNNSDWATATASCLMQAKFDTSSLLDVKSQDCTKLVARFKLQSPLTLRLRLKEIVHEIVEWDGSVTFYTSTTWSKEQGLQVNHHASLTMERTEQHIFAESVSFSIIIKNGSLVARHYSLEKGEFSISMEEDDVPKNQTEHHTEVVITRDAQDLFSPLEIYFTVRYQGKSELAIPLPSMYPKLGKMLSEKFMLGRPPPPLVIEYRKKGLFTTWRCSEVYEGQEWMTQFDRVEIPRLLPPGLKDDLILEIKELEHVHFQAVEAPEDFLESGKPFNLVWNYNVEVDRVYGSDLECRMSFDIQVGNSERIVSIDGHGWMPEIFIVDGLISSKATGEWREDENGNLAMFNLSKLISGQVMKVQLCLKEPVNHEAREPKIEYLLPSIVEKSVLGGLLECMIDGAICVLHNGDATNDIFYFSGNSGQIKTRLPKLLPRHSLRLIIPNVRYQPSLSRIIRFADEDCELRSDTSNDSQSSAETDLDAKNENDDENAEPQIKDEESKQTLQDVEDDALGARCEEIQENSFRDPSKASPQPHHVCGSQIHWRFRSIFRYPLGFFVGVYRRLKRTFLLTCVIQLALTQICFTWIPFDLSQLFSRNPIRFSDYKSEPSLDVFANRTMEATEDDLLITTAGRRRENVTRDGIQVHNHSQDMGQSKQEQPKDEVAKVMDWIDRALGWKGYDAP